MPGCRGHGAQRTGSALNGKCAHNLDGGQQHRRSRALVLDACTKIGALSPMADFTVIFYRTDAGNEPVRDWLHEMPAEKRRIIG